MSFSTLSPAVFAVGAALVAALLFALQRLRPRPRVVSLAGASLWAAAAHAAPRRVLTERFSRWLAYLLALAIALALWLAVAGPGWREAPDGRLHIFYLDAAAPMLAGDAFTAARDAMLADAAAIPAGDREVDLGGASPVRLLDRGEDVAVLRGRIGNAAAGAYPSAFGEWLGSAVSRIGRGRPATVHYYGFEAATAGAARRLPSNVALVVGYRAAPIAANHGIVALGVSPAASGAWDTADVLVRAADTRGATPGPEALRFTLDGRPFTPRRAERDGSGAIVLRDVAATGGTLRVAFARGDGFAADDSAAIVIPDRRPVRVALAPGVPDAFARVVALDPALRLVDAARAQVVVRRAGQAFGTDRPAFVLTGADAQDTAFAITDPGGQDDATLARDIEDLGIARIDSGQLAESTSRPIGVGIAPGSRRIVSTWPDIFARRAGFTQSRAMPLFVSQSLRWLARPAPWIPYAQAGAPLVDQSRLYGLAGDDALTRDGLRGDLVPGVAGTRRIGGRTVTVALDSTAISRLVAAPANGATGAVPWRRMPDLFLPALLLIAGLLLAIEWRLFLRRRIP